MTACLLTNRRGLRQSLRDGRHLERCARRHAQGRARQRFDALGVQIMTIELADEAPNLRKPLA
jgi:uncharacterized membrane protein